MGKDPHVNPGALDGLNFALDHLLCGRELFGSEADALAFDAEAPVSVCKRGAFGGSASWDRDDARVSLDKCYFARRKLMPRAHKQQSAILRRGCLRAQGGAKERMDGLNKGHLGLGNHRACASLVSLVVIPAAFTGLTLHTCDNERQKEGTRGWWTLLGLKEGS